jgi:hypothetical protein
VSHSYISIDDYLLRYSHESNYYILEREKEDEVDLVANLWLWGQWLWSQFKVGAGQIWRSPQGRSGVRWLRAVRGGKRFFDGRQGIGVAMSGAPWQGMQSVVPVGKVDHLGGA